MDSTIYLNYLIIGLSYKWNPKICPKNAKKNQIYKYMQYQILYLESLGHETHFDIN